MPPDKAVFEVRDIEPHSDRGREGQRVYTGVEKRRGNRRSGVDRRDEVRFEIGKEDRRQNPGRRAGDKSPQFW